MVPCARPPRALALRAAAGRDLRLDRRAGQAAGDGHDGAVRRGTLAPEERQPGGGPAPRRRSLGRARDARAPGAALPARRRLSRHRSAAPSVVRRGRALSLADARRERSLPALIAERARARWRSYWQTANCTASVVFVPNESPGSRLQYCVFTCWPTTCSCGFTPDCRNALK